MPPVSSLAPQFEDSPMAAGPESFDMIRSDGMAEAVGGDPLDPQGYLNADERVGLGANGKQSLTVEEAGMRLIGYAPGWSGALGVGFTVTYGFRASEPDRMPSDAAGFQRFSPQQINQAELALKGWSDVADIRFVRIGAGDTGEGAYTDQATILFSNYTSGVEGAAAFAYNPGVYRGALNGDQRVGDVWIRSTLAYNVNPTLGNYGGQVLAHELGHAIGLDHPSDYDSTTGSKFTYAVDAGYYEDSRQYTVMSYFNEYNTGADYGANYAAVPMLDDIAAAQFEYGANTTTRTGDTVYGFNATADRPWFIATSTASKLIFAVWDAGGRDTFDFSGYANNQLIDLRQGFFSNVGGYTGNVAVAMGVTIEDAKGGSGADRINGNSASNSLLGGGGNDTIDGGVAGQDFLRGEDGNDSLSGGAEFDDINGNMGNDTASGGAGDDWVVGGKDDDWLTGDAGGDIVFGNLGADTCDGGTGNDLVRGGQGDDVISGGDGDDWLSGDRGGDNVTGGPGADIFHGSQDAGIDRVTDFSLAQGDRVQLDPGTTYTLRQEGAETIIDMGGGHQMILMGVQLSSLTPGWIFGA